VTTTTTATVNGKAERIETILKRSVCLVLSCGSLGNYRRLAVDDMRIEKDGAELGETKREVSARARLFASKDLAPCIHVIASAKNRLRAMSVDGGTRIFGPATYMLPVLAVGEAERVLAEHQALMTEKVDELVKRLPTLIAERRAKLGSIVRESDFPSEGEVREAYRIDWNYISFGAPERLEEVDHAAYERAVAKHNANLADAYQDVVDGLRMAALTVMRDLADRLGPDKDGKPKVLRPTALRDLQELLGNLPMLNSIGEDDDLASVLARVGAVAQGVDVDTVRSAPAVRAMLLETATKAAEHLGALVGSGRRAMDLG
jgi:hypothetical protein